MYDETLRKYDSIESFYDKDGFLCLKIPTYHNNKTIETGFTKECIKLFEECTLGRLS